MSVDAQKMPQVCMNAITTINQFAMSHNRLHDA